MIDRRLVLALLAGFGALVCGVLGVVLDTALLGVVAGVLGTVAAVAAAAISAHARALTDELEQSRDERRRHRRELDALAAVFSEESARRRSSEVAHSGAPGPLGAPGGPDDASDGAASTFGDHAGTSGMREPVFDSVSGLLDKQFFPVIVQQRVAAARRQLQPMSVVLFELDGLAAAAAQTQEQALGVLGDVIRRTLRECDTACRLTETRAAAVLEDTAESGAAWAAERVRGALHGSPVGDSLTVSAGIACYPSHALSGGELMDMANRALDTARQHGRDHVEIAQAD
ncbi:MAG TPA: diguanylate cyclase [Acidimicrobiia bacterium]|nr:diguanylate cyclase [Acidimicrobiia bacterium]